MVILVTGGAGYVGSVVAETLHRDGDEVLVVDNLQQGHRNAVPKGVKFIQADIRNKVALQEVFQNYTIEAVMHMAAETIVEFSVKDPQRHFCTNVVGGLTLVETMMEHNVNKIIFSSTAAIYGEPQATLIEELHSKIPVNAYGESKLMFEHILDWYGRAYNLRHISLRYFNAAGASEYLGEDHCPETHLIPNVLKAAFDKGRPVPIFGTDYSTRDGTCVRDYIHVLDIAQAHILALRSLDSMSGKAYNLGNGHGYSVKEVVETAKKVTGIDIQVKTCPRRIGDPATLVASSASACEHLGWKPSFPQLESILVSSWKWLKEHPNGYGH